MEKMGIGSNKALIVKGILTAADWGEFDCIASVKISAINEEEYIIENFEEFIPYVHRTIHAVGYVVENTEKIIITDYEIL